ncbi:MAG: hypothetical protein SCH71_05720 [Desulfobulbaceae bacterium]|nr:hypothetical protein [Desulfobulbaceae bacterium]
MKIFFILLHITLIFILSTADKAFALQTHGSPEGLYAHQLAHLFFMICMGIFVYRIHRSALPANQGWKYIAMGSILLMAWNLWAFTGHFITLLISEESFILPAGNLVPSIHITSWKEILYYVLNMDHLLCVPALICFYLGLRRILAAFYPQSAADRCK